MKNILVALDLSTMDNKLIQAASLFSRLFQAESVKFLHVIPSFVMPEGVWTSPENILSSSFQINREVEGEMLKAIQPYFGENHGVNWSVEIKEGKTSKIIEASANESGTELLIVGKKKTSTHSGVAAKFVARKTKSHVFFINENADLEFKHLLVPIDFSQYSLKALEMAFKLQKANPTATITARHVIDFPPKELYLTGNYGLLALDWKEKVKDMFGQFANKHKLDISNINFEAIKNDDFDISAQISDYAHQNKADLIMLGAKGHSGLDDLFLGSVTEKLVTAEVELPVLVVR
jgi:nucleotide-binding universal stress UspA family protein